MTTSPASPPTSSPPPDRSWAGLLSRLGAHPLRLAFLLLPFTIGGVVGDALAARSGPVRLTTAVLAWAAWVLALLATFVPHPIGLTVLRVSGPVAALAAVAATIAARPVPWAAVVAIVAGVVAGALALSPATADRCVDGRSYGPETRVALRIPLPLLLGPVPLAWALVVGGLATGPLLLAVGRWAAGGAATVVGFAAALAGLRSLHGLSNRFVVLVPAGFVLHDRAALLDPVLFSRAVLASVGPAPAGTDATDLTLGATGLVLEARMNEPVDLPLRTGRNASSMVAVEAVLFCPLRPGRLLEQLARHGLPRA